MCTSTGEYYFTLKRIEVHAYGTTQMILKESAPSDRSQSHMPIGCVLRSCEKPRIGKSLETENRLEIARDWEEEGLGEQVRSALCGVMKMFWN